MAAKKAGKPAVGTRVITETREEPVLPDDEIDPTAEGADEDTDLLTELQELGGGDGARYEVRRTAPADYVGHIGTYSRDEFSLDRLMEEWGGGKFTIRVRGMGGQIIGSKPIQLAGKPKHKSDAAPAVVQQQAPGMGGELAAVLSAIQASNQAAAQAGKDQISLLTTLVTGLINKEPPKLPPPPDPLAMIAALKDVLKPEKGDTGAEAVKLLLQGVTLGKELGGGGDGEMDMGTMLMKGIDGIKEIATIQTAGAPARRPVPARAPARLAGPEPGTVPAREPIAPVVKQGDPPMMQLLAWLKQQTVMLCHQAARGKNPALYAELMLDNLPPFVTEELIREHLGRDDAVSRLAMVNGDVAKHKEWFEQFRTELIGFLDADAEGAPGGESPVIEAGPGVEIVGDGSGSGAEG